MAADDAQVPSWPDAGTEHIQALSGRTTPPAATPHIQRRALAQLLNRLAEHPVVIVRAGPGYGKTQTLAQFWRQRKGRKAWLTLDPLDAEAENLLPALGRALAAAGLTVGLRLSWDSGEAAVAEAANNLLTALAASGEPVTLALDDAQHLAGGGSGVRLLERVLSQLPPQCRVVLAGRQAPPLPRERWLVQGRCAELTDEHLRMDAGEIARLYASVYGIPLSRAGAERLAADTGGWPAALLLLQYDLQPRSEAAVLERLQQAAEPGVGIYEYLLSEVVQALPPEVERFLCESSLLPALEPALCDELLQRQDSAAVLEGLRRAGLFTYRLTAAPMRYAYHPLFGQVLRRRLAGRDAVAYRRLLAGAAAAFARRDEPLVALDCYLNAGDYPAAARLLLEMFHSEAQPPLRTVLAWLPRFPDSMRRTDPTLLVIQGHLEFRKASLAEAERLCARARELAHRQAPEERARVLLAAARLLLFDMQDPQGGEAVLAELEPLLPAAGPRARADMAMLRAELHSDDLQRRVEELRTAVDWFAASGNAVEQRRALLYLSHWLIQLGQLREAAERLAPWRPGAPHLTLNGAAALDLQLGICLRRGDRGGAESLLAPLLVAAAEFGDPLLTFRATTKQFEMHLHAGRLAAAEAALKQLQAQPKLSSPGCGHLHILCSELHLLRGEVAGALAEAEQACAISRADGRLLYANFWRAPWALSAAAMAAGQWERALYLLRQPQPHPTPYSRWAIALAIAYLGLKSHLVTAAELDQELQAVDRLGAPEGYGLLPYHPEMEAVVFEACRARGMLTPYVRAALQRLGRLQSAGEPAAASVLSHRETAVLQLLVQGLTNREIAERLEILEGTVKAYNRRLFEKLDVRNRTELVARMLSNRAAAAAAANSRLQA